MKIAMTSTTWIPASLTTSNKRSERKVVLFAPSVWRSRGLQPTDRLPLGRRFNFNICNIHGLGHFPPHQPKKVTIMKAHQLRPKRTTKHSLRFRLAPAALLLCALGGCATDKEKQTATATPDRFAMADANHDGKLSQNEASDFIAGQIFDAKDTQKKGSVTEQEWAAGDPAAAANFKKQDTNHDGVLTKQESLQYNRSAGTAKKAFNAADTNHDGSLDRAEVQSYYGDREGSPF